MNLSSLLPKKIGVSSGLLVALLLLSGFFGYWNIREIRENDAWVVDSHCVLDAVDQLLSLLDDAETGERGFVITEEREYLEPYYNALDKIAGQFEKLQQLTGDSPRYGARIAALRELADAKLKRLAQGIALARQSAGDARRVAARHDGRRIMDDFRKQIDALRGEERTLLAGREQNSRQKYLWATISVVTSFLCSTGMLLFLLWMIRQYVKALQGSERRLRSLLDALPVGVNFSEDVSCHFVRGNPAALVQFSLQPGENLSASAPDASAVGRKIRYFHYGRELSAAELPMQRAIAENRITNPMELEVVMPDGRRWFAATSGAPIRDADGVVVCGIAITEDITAQKQAEKVIVQSLEKEAARRRELETLMETVPVGVFIARDRECSNMVGNNLVYDLLSMAKQSNVSQSAPQEERPDFSVYRNGVPLSPEDLSVQKAARTGEPIYGEEMELRFHKGGSKWIYGNAVPLHDGQGEVIGAVGAFMDITAQKRSEIELHSFARRMEETVVERTSQLAATIAQMERTAVALRDSEQRFAAFLNNSPAIAWLKDDAGRHVYHNETYENYFQIRSEEWRGKSDFELWPKEMAELFWRNDQDVLQHHRAIQVLEETKRADGAVDYWLNSKFPLVDSAGDKFVGGIGINVTKQKLAENRLRESERIYRAIGESIEYGVWMCTPDGRNTYTSESFLHLVGRTQQQCADFGWGDLLHPDEADETVEAWRECVSRGGIWDCEHRYRGVDGAWHPILSRGIPVRNDEGEIICWAGINLDISRLKQAESELVNAKEAAEVANQAKSRFLATMSHDLRTPLNAVIGFSEFLLVDPVITNLGGAQKENISLIAKAGRHLLNLVEGLLNVAAIESGQVKLTKEMLDLKGLLKDISKTYELLARERGIHWFSDIRITRDILADRHRIWEVLNNLVSNALKYTPPIGLITLGAREDGEGVTIFVKDTGTGIDKVDLERIFLPFEQGGSPGVDKLNKSVGLGLSISRQLVELHGGTLTVESIKGEGSCFTVILPYTVEKV